MAADGAGRTVLLDDVSGADQWDPAETVLVRMVQDLVVLQARWADRVDELISAGLPDWRAAAFPDLVRRVLFRPEVLAQLNEADRARLEPLVAGLAERFDSLAACSLPDTLVHGDFHPGNWRGDGPTLILLDWGDAGVGHPLLDLSAFEATLAHDVRESVRREWFAAWRTARPQCDPARAAELIGPIASLRQALVYQNFLDGIEPDERHYHRADVPAWLHRAVSEPAQPRS